MKWSHLLPWDGKRWDHSHQKYGNVLLKLTKKDTASKISPLSSVLVAGRCGNGGNEHTTLEEIVTEVAHNDHISSIRKSPKKSKTQSLYCVTRSTGGPTESLLIFGIHQDISTIFSQRSPEVIGNRCISVAKPWTIFYRDIDEMAPRTRGIKRTGNTSVHENQTASGRSTSKDRSSLTGNGCMHSWSLMTIHGSLSTADCISPLKRKR